MVHELPLIPFADGPAFYTGVGSRDISRSVELMMERIGWVLAQLGYILRSGGADGSDKAFEHGCVEGSGEKRIWRPKHATPEAIELASKYHGAWYACNEHARRLHGRNAFQVLGRDLQTPSQFVICYTHDGCIYHEDRTQHTGGTGTAISIASENNIPVYNLKLQRHLDKVGDWLDTWN
jgi:hypothetical protein